MTFIEIITKKRDGLTLSPEEISYFVKEYVKDNIPDYQVSALLMAIYLNGLTDSELFALTREMIASGESFDFSELQATMVDKHSTGGVGDKVSLIIAPIAAACGCKIPMMAGRGLGHTGGTLDKMESIPGYRIHLELPEVKEIIRECGYVIMGQTKKVVPADKKLYALRDVTGTVESIPLISSSIMSKKIAEGTDALVMDIKCGKGAFMQSLDRARALGEKISAIGRDAGKKMAVLITAMDQPLGNMIGNYLEVIESIRCLKGEGPVDLMEVSIELAARMIYLSGRSGSLEEAKIKVDKVLTSGEAYNCFKENVRLQGGNIDYLDLNSSLYTVKHTYNITAKEDGYIEELDAYKFGLASTIIGAGRLKLDDIIDYPAGIELFKKVGDKVDQGEKIASVYYNEEKSLSQSLSLCNEAIRISRDKVDTPPVILAELG